MVEKKWMEWLKRTFTHWVFWDNWCCVRTRDIHLSHGTPPLLNRDTTAKLDSTAERKCRTCGGAFFILLLGEGHSFTFSSCCTETPGTHRARLGDKRLKSVCATSNFLPITVTQSCMSIRQGSQEGRKEKHPWKGKKKKSKSRSFV